MLAMIVIHLALLVDLIIYLYHYNKILYMYLAIVLYMLYNILNHDLIHLFDIYVYLM
jgi:hypothetical protein